MKIIYTDTAKEGIDFIYQFNAQINQATAIKIYNRILDEIEILRSFPVLAPLEPLLDNNPAQYRSFIIMKGRIKVIYCFLEDTIYIVSIWDCRQNPEELINNLKSL